MTVRDSIANTWHKIRTNGCTASPDLWYLPCCDDHDRHYATGRRADGSTITRAEADAQLYRCMKQRRHGWPLTGYLVPGIYWLAVRLFGRRHWKQTDQA